MVSEVDLHCIFGESQRTFQHLLRLLLLSLLRLLSRRELCLEEPPLSRDFERSLLEELRCLSRDLDRDGAIGVVSGPHCVQKEAVWVQTKVRSTARN